MSDSLERAVSTCSPAAGCYDDRRGFALFAGGGAHAVTEHDRQRQDDAGEHETGRADDDRPRREVGDHPGRRSRRSRRRARGSRRACRARRAVRCGPAAARTGSSFTTRSSRARRTPARSRRAGRRARTRCAARRRFTSKYVSRPGVGLGEEAHEHLGLLGREAPHARGEDLGEHGVGERGARAPGRDRLDHRVAEALPRRREHDEVARRVRVGDAVGAAERHRASSRSFDDACERVARSRLRPGPTTQRCTGRSVMRARDATRRAPRRARSCARSRATVGARRARRRGSRTAARVAARSPGGGSRSKKL